MGYLAYKAEMARQVSVALKVTQDWMGRMDFLDDLGSKEEMGSKDLKVGSTNNRVSNVFE